VLKRCRSRAHLGQGRVASLEAEAREPSQRGALVAVWLGLADRHAHRQGVAEIDAGQFRRSRADDLEVAGLQCVALIWSQPVSSPPAARCRALTTCR
jgi:hypothetical protein